MERFTYTAAPLFDDTPHSTDQWTAYYASDLTLQVIMVEDTPQLRHEVMDWIRSKNVIRRPISFFGKWATPSRNDLG